MNPLKGIFASTNVIETLKPWYLLSGLIGACPFEIVQSARNDYRLKLSWKIFISLAIFSNFLYVFISYYPSVGEERQMNQLISLGDYTLYTVLSICFLFSHLFKSKKSLAVLEKIMEIDSSFSSINVTFPHVYFKKLTTFGLIGLFTLILSIYTIHTHYALFISAVFPAHICFTHAFNEEWRMCYLFKTYVTVLTIKYRLMAINQEIIKIQPRKSVKDFAILAKNSELLFEKRAKHDFHKIYKLRLLHDKLCDVCEVFNEVESTPMIFSLTAMAILIIANIFYCYSAWYNHSDWMVFRFLHMLLLMTHHSMFGVPLVVAFARLAKEANRTPVLVQKVLGDIGEVEVENQFQLFSNQLLHRKVLFTAHGFFPLDNSLIYTIAGTITSYLVILIQFQNIDPQRKTNKSGYDISKN